jgi:hypothetical protein
VEVENYLELHGSKPNEVFLYHGTRNTLPSEIYGGGFDMRYSDGGMWGRAIYFAVRSAYSHDYKY